jgi:hypothetical protein
MTRLSKQERKRRISPRKPRSAAPKTGPKKDNLEFGFKVHENAISAESTPTRYIPKIG